MNEPQPDERTAWARVTQLLGTHEGVLEARSTSLMRNDPARLSVVLARAKFIARLVTVGRRVVEFKPNEPLASRILAEAAVSYLGIDFDERFVAAANKIYGPIGLKFQTVLPNEQHSIDTFVALDVAQAAAQAGFSPDELLDQAGDLLADDGVAALVAHTPLCSELREALEDRFSQVFSFRCHGETITADDAADADEVLLLAMQPKRDHGAPQAPPRSLSELAAIHVEGPALELGRHLSHWLHNSPRRLLHSMSYYRFAAALIGRDGGGLNRPVLDIGCGEGWGTWLIAQRCGSAIGVDFDAPAVDVARRNFTDARVRFICGDVFKVDVEPCRAVVNFDCIEHIQPANVERFWQQNLAWLPKDGIAVVGTPSLTSDAYANPTTRAGHVNLYTGDRLEAEMARYFRTVLLFSANDELVHTGFRPLAHYYIAVGIGPRETPLGQPGTT